jgi:hypothetical protein
MTFDNEERILIAGNLGQSLEIEQAVRNSERNFLAAHSLSASEPELPVLAHLSGVCQWVVKG